MQSENELPPTHPPWQAPAMIDRSLGVSTSSGFAARLACALLFAVASACARKNQAPGAIAPAAPASAGSAAGAPVLAASNARRAGHASIFVVHMMNDFDGFKKYFEDGAAERARAGVKGYLLTKLDDGRAVVHFFAEDVAVVEAALRSPDLQQYLDRKGAPEASLLWLTRDVVVKVPPVPPAGQTYSLYLKLRTANLQALEAALRNEEAKFAERAVIAYGLHQSTASASIAILHFVGTAKDELAALPEEQAFRDLLLRAESQFDSKALVGLDVDRGRPE